MNNGVLIALSFIVDCLTGKKNKVRIMNNTSHSHSIANGVSLSLILIVLFLKMAINNLYTVV